MPAHKSAIKRLKQAEKNRKKNGATKSEIKTMRKKLLALLTEKKDEAKKGLPLVQSEIDKAAKRGIIHRRKAARLKSRLMRKISATPAAAKA